MRRSFPTRIAGRAALALAIVACLATAAGAQTAAEYRAPRTPDGRPDLNGIWQALNTANWDLEAHVPQPAPNERAVGVYLAQPGGLSVVVGGKIPYKPEALKKKQENFKTRLQPDALNREIADPEAKCFRPNPPRATYMPYPFQIVQTPGKVLFAYEFGQEPRVVRMGNVKPWPEYETTMGDNIGRWEGETLVVDVTQLNGIGWLDRAGNYTSTQTHIVERYTALSPNHLMYEATIEDPTLFIRPWTIRMPLYRRIEEHAQLIEFECIPLSEEFLYHKYYTQETLDYLDRTRTRQ